MQLTPYEKMLLGSVLVGFGIAVLADFSLLKAALYFGVVLLSALFFL